MELVAKILLILIGVAAFAILLVLGWIEYWFATKQSDIEVASDVDISTDWIELTPKPPLRARKHCQYVLIFVDGCDTTSDDSSTHLFLPDGTSVTVDLEILDNTSKAYKLSPSLFIESGVGYSGNYAARSSFPQDKPFTRIRMRSDKPFRASKIIWENYNLK